MNTAFLRISQNISRIIPCLSKDKQRKENPFVVVNTDNGYGYYVRELVRLAKSYGLTEQSGTFSQRSVRNINTSDIIIFGDAPAFCDFDYRVETDLEVISKLDGRRFKVYGIVDDFKRVKKRLREYALNNNLVSEKQPRSEGVSLRLNVNVQRPTVKLLAVKEPALQMEKVTVHNNWVKVGYRQYDIYVDLFGNEFIKLEDGTKFWVKENRWGQRFLAQ